LSQLVHERVTSERFGDLLAASEGDASLAGDPDVSANLREVRRGYDRAIRIPGSLVREIAETTTHAQHAWRDARERSDYAAFAPWLEKTIQLSRRKAECLSTSETEDLYDALLDIYEPAARASRISAVFADLRSRLAPLIREIADAEHRPDSRIHGIRLPIAE